MAVPVQQAVLRWHLVLTKPRGEAIATDNLTRQGYRVYSPRIRQKTFKCGSWRDSVSPLFPRYVFVQLNSAVQSLAPIRSTVGVASVVRFGTEYSIVPERIIAGLIASEDPQSGLHTLSSTMTLKPGDGVRILDGALAGIEGIFECADGNERVVVLLDFLGRQSRIQLPASSVVANQLLS